MFNKILQKDRAAGVPVVWATPVGALILAGIIFIIIGKCYA